MARERRSKDQLKEIDALVERLREFVRLNYVTAAEVARRIGVRDSTVYSWLQGECRPAKPETIVAFLEFFTEREWIRHRSNGIRISRIQELAGYPKASPLPVLQAGEGRNSESAWWVCRCLSKLPCEWPGAGDPRRRTAGVEWEGGL
jgi:transcriptional regulator with XRE-family HTH domain